MNLKTNKKGDQTFNTLTFMFFKVGFLIIVLFFLVYLYKSYVVTKIDVTDLEAQIFTHSILNNKDGIIYYDEEIDRSYPEIIDLSKFNDKTMEQIESNSIFYGKDNRHLAAKLELIDESGQIINKIVYNNKWYERWHTLAKTKVKGPGGSKEIVSSFYVLIKNKETIEKGFLNISITIPNN
ncbi:hypothetical protein CMO93_03295 [Candidatus Woesearchaeota archaeon]|nr:hypothetical protein [Candidatus Woesearchaeota archaeon]|tara:strand:+ start:395 stop:937 length:543 start_codon:yes stop_codon:yes gene_type:complete